MVPLGSLACHGGGGKVTLVPEPAVVGCRSPGGLWSSSLAPPTSSTQASPRNLFSSGRARLVIG